MLRALGAHVRRLRLERRLSQESLAELSGLNYKYIGKVELAKANPGATVLVRLARGLRVPVGELFATIASTAPGAPPLPPAEADAMRAALATLTAVVNRVLAGQPAPLPARAPRRARR